MHNLLVVDVDGLPVRVLPEEVNIVMTRRNRFETASAFVEEEMAPKAVVDSCWPSHDATDFSTKPSL